MKLRGVLIATALVVVLTSNLLGGWTYGSLVRQAMPTAHAQTKLTQDQAFAWWAGFGTHNNVGITISERAGQAPSFSLPADDTNNRNRPELKFSLAAVHGTYTSYSAGLGLALGILGPWAVSKAGSNVAWTIWSVSTSDGDTVPNLIAVGDNKGAFGAGASHWEVYWIADPTQVTSGSVATATPADADKVVSLVMRGDGGGSGSDTYQNLYRYLFNEPSSGDSCASGTKFTTGPSLGTPPGPVRLARTGRDIETLNSNCINQEASGWANYWGITNVTSQAGDAVGCSINEIASQLRVGLGEVLTKMISCLVFGLGQSTNDYIRGGDSPFLSVACLSQHKPALIESALAQNDNGEECKTDNNKVGSFENELSNPKGTIMTIWKISLGLVNVVVILALLAIAFANILHLNISTYAAKKALPGIVIGVVGANASLLIVRFLADITSAVSIWAVTIADSASIAHLITGDFPAAIARGIIFSPAGVTGILLLILPILLLYYLFLIVAFIFSLFKRIIILYFLVMIAPLAFVSYGVPGFQQYFSKWWDALLRYLFLFPIILFGMALTIKLSGTLAATSSLSAPGITSIILVFAAATLILKLPKMLTKGAIDTAAGFKRLIGYAPALMAAGGAAHGALSRGRIAKLGQRIEELGSNRVANKEAIKHLRRDRIAAINSAGKWKKIWGGGRGYATLFARPELLQEAYDQRIKRLQKLDYISAMTKTSGIPGMIRGSAVEYEVARGLALDELKDARSPAEVRNWDDGLGKGHLSRVYNKTDKNKNLWEIIKKVTGGDERKIEMLRQKFGDIKNEDDMIDFITKPYNDNDPLAGGLGAKYIWNYHDLGKASGRESTVTKLVRQARSLGRRGDPYSIDVQNLPQVDPGGRDAVPFGTARDEDNNTASGSSSIRGRVAASTAAFIRDDVADTVKETFRNLSDQWRDTLDSLTITTDPAQVKRLSESLATLQGNSLSALSSALTADGQRIVESLRTIQGEAGQDAVRQTLENISAALDMGVHSGNALQADLRRNLEQTVEAAHTFSTQVSAVNNSAANQFTTEQISSLLSQPVNELVDRLDEKLSPLVDQLGRVAGRAPDPTFNRQLAQTLSNELRQAISARGPRSLGSIIQSTFANFGTRIAKEWRLHQISTGSVVNAIAQAQTQSGSTNQTNVTNVQNNQTINQTTNQAAPPEPPSPEVPDNFDDNGNQAS